MRQWTCLCLLLATNLLVIGSGLASAQETEKLKSPVSVCQIGSERELFVEDDRLDRLAGKAELRLHHPLPQEVVMEHNAPWEGSGGDLVTKPLTLSGKPLPGHSLDDCEELFGDALDSNATWKRMADLSPLVDHAVRVRFVQHAAVLLPVSRWIIESCRSFRQGFLK